MRIIVAFNISFVIRNMNGGFVNSVQKARSTRSHVRCPGRRAD